MSFITLNTQRLWLNFRRHRPTLLISIPTIAIFMTLLMAIAPGPEGIAAYANISIVKVLLGITDIGQISEGQALFFWTLIMSNILLYIVPVIGIFLGIRMLPFNERDGKELLLSTNKSMIRYFIENFLLVMILIPLIILPTFLVGVGFLSISSEYISGLAIALFLPGIFMMVIAMITVFGASLRSSSKFGYAIGGFFFIYSFTLNLLASEIPAAVDFNLLSQMNTFQQGLAGEILNDSTFAIADFSFQYNRYIVTSLLLIVVLFFATIYFLYRIDYIEPRTSYMGKIKGVDTSKILTKISFIRRPMKPILNKVGWRYPAFRDQLQSSASTFLLYGAITAVLVMTVLIAYPGDAEMAILFTEMSSIINNPLMSAFMFGANPTPTLEGFLVFKLLTFHWIYYMPFVFIGTYSIVMRDKVEHYDEITWSMPRKKSRIVMQRTIAMLIYLWIIVLFNWIAFWIGEIMLSTFKDVIAPDVTATVGTFVFLGFGYSIFLILFVTLALIPKQRYMVVTLAGAFVFTLIVMVIPEVITDLDWISYLSPFQYFNVIGILLNDTDIIGSALPAVIAAGTVVTIFYLVVVNVVTPRKDIV